MQADNSIGVGILGLGVIGAQVAHVLLQQSERISHQAGIPIVLQAAVDVDVSKLEASRIPKQLRSTDPSKVLENPNVDILLELIGGVSPALEILTNALSNGKHVVTANKELMAKHGPQLINLADEKGLSLLYEASVGGGIPILGPLKNDLLANNFTSIRAIINGTTNYILTKMSREGLSFNTALGEAQRSGFAETDPTNDVEGFDAAYKLAILANLAFHTQVMADDVYREGVTRLAAQDFQYAEELGYAIKLLAIAQRGDATLSLRVHPALVPQDQLLAKVDGVFNAIEIEGDLAGRILLHGQGAGPLPTSSAVVGNVVEIARGLIANESPARHNIPSLQQRVSPMEELITRYYVRLTVADHAGVMAQITQVLGVHSISIASVIQKNSNPEAQTAEIVVTTHPAQESSLQTAIHVIEKLDVVVEVGNLIRVEQWQ